MDIRWELYYQFQKHCHTEHRALQAYLAGMAILPTMNHQRDSSVSVVINQNQKELKRKVSVNLGIMAHT